MSTFDVSAYNSLPFIADASTRLESQLASAGLTRSEFFTKLVPLFREASYDGKYAVCLIHRHYALNDGERMVTTGDSTKPSTDTSANIVGERWACNGEVIEHKSIDDPASHPLPPSPEFFSKFKSIVDAHGIDILGVSYAPGKLEDNFLFLESPGPGDREQVTKVVHRLSDSEEQKHSFEAAWIPRFDSKTGFYTMGGCSDCSPGCPPPDCPKYLLTCPAGKFGIKD